MSTALEYHLHIDDVDSHLLEVRITIPVEPGQRIVAMLPSWTPGSYLMREYARYVQEFKACIGEAPLAFRKIEKHKWAVEIPEDAAAGAPLVLRYRVYGYELSVRAVHIDDSHAFVNGPAALMLIEGMEDQRHAIDIQAPDPSWRIHTSLDDLKGPAPKGRARFEAPDYTTLADCPIEMGPMDAHSFEALGITHRLVFWGDHRAPVDRMVGDLKTMVEAAAGLFGGALPYDRYLFIVLGSASGRGGLEHLSSTALQFPLRGYSTEKGYEDFMTLASHEHFHVWNVKRIRPAVLGPFDYSREAYTRALWVMEGFTCYYENIVLLEAGLMKRERFVELLLERYAMLLSQPGRRVQSLEESSFDAWIKLYRPHGGSKNSTISYYLKGELVACLLDLEIRRRTEGARSLHDVTLELWAHFLETGAGFVEDDFQRIVEATTELELEAFFDKYVRGTEDLPFTEALSGFGLELVAKDVNATAAWLGVNHSAKEGFVTLDAVLTGSPAARGGLYVDDELVAVDGLKTTAANLGGILESYKAGEQAKLHVFRRGILREVTVEFGSAPAHAYTATFTDGPHLLRDGWLGES